MTVFDMLGKQIIVSNEPLRDKKLNIQFLAPCTYILRVSNGGAVKVSFKLVKN